jgi:hypothetical protein
MQAVVFELPGKRINWMFYQDAPEPQLQGHSLTLQVGWGRGWGSVGLGLGPGPDPGPGLGLSCWSCAPLPGAGNRGAAGCHEGGGRRDLEACAGGAHAGRLLEIHPNYIGYSCIRQRQS